MAIFRSYNFDIVAPTKFSSLGVADYLNYT